MRLFNRTLFIKKVSIERLSLPLWVIGMSHQMFDHETHCWYQHEALIIVHYELKVD